MQHIYSNTRCILAHLWIEAVKTFLWHVEWITACTHHPSEKFGLPLHSPHSQMLSIHQRLHRLEFAGFLEVDVKMNTSSRTATVSLLKTHISGHKLVHTSTNKYTIFSTNDKTPGHPGHPKTCLSPLPYQLHQA